jgi:hypothetical protein
MKAVDFYKLPRAIQDRFVGSVMNGFPPVPILAAKGGTPHKVLWLGASAAAFVLLIAVVRVGFGALDSALSLHSAAALPLYLGLVFAFGFGLLQAFARVVRERAVPYSAGVYLFPGCLIDARSDQFKIHEIKDLAGIDVQGGAIRVTFAGGAQFLFPLAQPAHAPDIITAVQLARERTLHAIAGEDQKELVAVDPLHNPRFSSPVGPREPYEMAQAPWGKLGPVVAGGLALVLAPTIWFVRNSGSDKTLYARATQANTADAYRSYLAHGEEFQDEVGGTLLPLAELREAEKVGTVDALLAYKESHPGSKIASDVSRSLKNAMLTELEKAKQPGTLASLQAFAKRYPEHGVQPELTAAIHAVYARELDAYQRRAPRKDAAATAFVERLFAWAERRGPKVEIRFRRKASASMDRADQAVMKSPTFTGVVTYPSRFFDERHVSAREDALAKSLATQLGSGLSPELFEVGVGPAVTDGDLPEPKAPTLFVTHQVEWSGHMYTSNRPRGSYVGLQFNVEASFVIPGDAKPYKMRAEIFKHAATYVLNEPGSSPLPTGEAEEKVYETMAQGALDEFGRRLLAAFFVPAK